MKTRTALECVLLFLIGFQAIDIALASYAKIPLDPPDHWNVVRKPGLKLPVDVVPHDRGPSRYSDVICVMRGGSTNCIQYQVFSGNECDLLMALSIKIDKKAFADFMATSLATSRSAFMASVLDRLQALDLIASN